MTEMISGAACCDLVSKEGSEGYALSFNPGRLIGAVIVAALGAGSSFVI